MSLGSCETEPSQPLVVTGDAAPWQPLRATKMSQTTSKSSRSLQSPGAFLSDLFHSPVPCRGRRQGRFQSRLCSDPSFVGEQRAGAAGQKQEGLEESDSSGG